MSYPPGSSGYPPAQQPTSQFAAPTQQFNRPSDAPAEAAGPSKLPFYLTIAVAVLGILAFFVDFGPNFTVDGGSDSPLGALTAAAGLGQPITLALLAGLLAGVSLLPKQKDYTTVAAVIAVVAFLLVISALIDKPEGVSIGWALYLNIVFTLLQTIAAIAAVLFAAGVITPPAPKPKYDQQQQYGQYGAQGGYGGYGQPQHPGQQPQQGRPGGGYPSQYGGYPGGPSTGGFSAIPQGGQSGGPATPPTGFPTYGQPPSSTAHTTQAPVQQQPPSSPQSGPSQS